MMGHGIYCNYYLYCDKFAQIFIIFDNMYDIAHKFSKTSFKFAGSRDLNRMAVRGSTLLTQKTLSRYLLALW